MQQVNRFKEALVEGVEEIEKQKYRVFDQITVISNRLCVKLIAQAIARNDLRPQGLEALNIYVYAGRFCYPVFREKRIWSTANVEASEKEQTLMLFLSTTDPERDSQSFEFWCNKCRVDPWEHLEPLRQEDEKLDSLGKTNVLFGMYTDYCNLLDNGVLPKVLKDHPLFAK